MNPKRNRARDVGFYVLLVLILIAVIFTMTKDTEPDQLDNYSELVDQDYPEAPHGRHG